MTAFDEALRIVVQKDDPAAAFDRRRYLDLWHAVGCHLMDPGLALIVFDAAVNCGESQAARWLQSALGVTSVDGVIGPVTRAALEHADAEETLTRVQALRTRHAAAQYADHMPAG